jgi:cell division protein FtsI/penicillin-binding protein 2
MMRIRTRTFALLLLTGMFASVPSSGRGESSVPDQANDAGTSLFTQSVSQVLNRDFPSDDISFLLLDARTGAVLVSRWDHAEAPIPLGSLVKPFTALAYGELHKFKYPMHVCRGTTTGCWLPRGHGEVDLISAVAYSCNSYFRMLTADMTATEVSPTAIRFGLQPPALEVSGSALAGLGNRWLISPLNMSRAYIELLRRRDQPGVRLVLAGMARSARQGTGAGVDRALSYPDALVKTGTASCTHNKHASGDGFTVAIAPADHPQILLTVRVHGVPGAEAAKTAGQMLRRIEE